MAGEQCLRLAQRYSPNINLILICFSIFLNIYVIIDNICIDITIVFITFSINISINTNE